MLRIVKKNTKKYVQKLKDSNNVNVTKFSNSLYFKYNKFVERINDYEKYLNKIENKIDKKFEGKNI